MDIMDFLKEKRPEIDGIMERYLPRNLDEKTLEEIFGRARYCYDEKALTESLSKPIWDFLDRPGKRIRPALFLLTAEALGGDMKKIRDFAIVVECAHEGSIIIDDIEDLGEIRRGKPCMHKTFGEDIAINAGNFMYFLPMLVFMKHSKDFDKETTLRAWGVFAQEMMNIHAGQAMDIYWHRGKKEDVSEEEYMQMCAYKTGCLTRMAMKLAAVLSGADQEKVEKLGRLAEVIGIGFQIQDDVLSASGEEFQKSKGFGDDITEGKRSLIVIHALKNAVPEDRKRLLEILDRHTKDERLIKEAMEIINKHKSIEYAKEFAKKLVSEAWADIEPLLPESGGKEKLMALANFLIEREI